MRVAILLCALFYYSAQGQDSNGMSSSRLLNGSDQYEGQLQLLVNGTWRPICSSDINSITANRVCQSAGFKVAVRVFDYPYNGADAIYDDIYCNTNFGTIRNLSDCYTTEHAAGQQCSSNTTLGFVCSDEFSLRIVNPNNTNHHYEGRVEVYYSGQWGTICSYYHSNANARVICQELGYPDARTGSLSLSFGTGTADQPIWLSYLYCQGSEQSVADCFYYLPWDNGLFACSSHSNDLAVSCIDVNETLPVYPVRLAIGSYTNGSLWYGRVEIFYNSSNEWGTICDDSWTIEDANVVCRQLGYIGAESATSYGTFGQGSGTIWIDDVLCKGSEDGLSQCLHSGWGVHNCQHSEDAGVICTNPDVANQFKVRLVDDSGNVTSLLGSVEVFYGGMWGRVCSTYWDIGDANVVCRQLGYGYALQAGRSVVGSSMVWMDSVQCNGTETSLELCNFPGFGVAYSYCSTASVVCTNNSASPSVRLVGGANSFEGRVEIYHNNTWGTICHNYWNVNAATVLCRQLGYYGTASTATFGPGADEQPIWLTKVNCTGNENFITECAHRPWGRVYCHHRADAGVTCSVSNYTIPVRLADGSGDREGRVEVLLHGQWGTICDPQFNRADANVVCRQLGFSASSDVYTYSQFGGASSTTPFALGSVYCSGQEAQLGDCYGASIKNTPSSNCNHSTNDVGIRCYGEGYDCVWCSPDVKPNVAETDPTTNAPIRLADGPTENVGRVEVYVNGVWGTICDDFWSNEDAEVVCRQLGYSSEGAVAISYAYYGQGSDAIVLDDVRCVGTELLITDCPNNGPFNHNCRHYEDASVNCSANHTQVSVRLMINGTQSVNEGRVELLYNGTWGSICDDFWDYNDAVVICHMLGFATAIRAYSNAYFGQANSNSPILLDDVRCTGQEVSITDCVRSDWYVHNCRHYEDAGVSCTNHVPDEYPLRLVGGSTPAQGRLEVFYNGQWGSVCDDYFGGVEARVACAELGYAGGEATDASLYGSASEDVPIWMDNVDCSGSEEHLSDCSFNGWGDHNCVHSEDVGVTCTEPLEPIRLVGGGNLMEGTVQVYHNMTWGTICDDYWDIQDATVVCHQLGFYRALQAVSNARFGSGSGPIWLDDVACSGTESGLSQCSSSNWGAHNCRHSEDAGVICSNETAQGNNTIKVQLVGGRNGSEGRVEVWHNGVWGTVCDDSWDINDANVICRQIGFDHATEAISYSGFGQGSGVIWLDDVACYGSESNIGECLYNGWNTSNCRHVEDAGVRCYVSGNYIRLVDGNSPEEGRVEIYHNGEWGSICDDGWDMNEAKVVCLELGFQRALAAVGYGTFGEADPGTRILLDDVRCTGDETSILYCPHSPWGEHNCDHDEDAAVICSAVPPDPHPIRLVGGKNELEGRVEIFYDGEWGTICDDYWDINDANVVCNSLGYPGAAAANASAEFGVGRGRIWLDDVDCSGTELFLSDCNNTGWGVHNCLHLEDAGVTCNRENWPIRLAGNTVGDRGGRVEIYYNNTWGTVCDDLWSIDDGNVVCRMLNFGGAVNVSRQAAYGEGTGRIWLDDVYCTGNEATIYECSHSGWAVQNCRHSEDAGVLCYKNCPTFSFPNGEFEGSFAPKGRLTFSCNDGYALNGVPELTCEPSPINDDPYWNDPIPHCNKICPNLTAPAHGICNEGCTGSAGTTITFSCEPHYVIHGLSQTTCTKSGTWSNPIPVCLVSCDVLTPPSYGKCSSSPCTALEGGRLNFTCNNGYLLKGVTDLVCLNTGRYTAAVPECIGECPTFTVGANVQCSPSCEGITVGSTIMFSCKPGYEMADNQAHAAICKADRTWSLSSAPVCKAVCQRFDPGQGTCSSDDCSVVSGNSVTVQCNNGFTLEGSSSVTCLQNGSWDKPTPHCTKTCSQLTTPTNGHCNPCIAAVGQQAHFTCNDQYTLIGSSSVTCLSGGQWSGPAPTCKRHCPLLDHPTNGTCVPEQCQAFTGDSVHFTCEDGYKLTGSPSLLCLSNAIWNASVPQCKRKCKDISASAIQCDPSSCSGSAGDTLQLSCLPGYTLQGVSLLTCGADGHWSSEIPTCTKSCTAHHTPAHGSCSPANCTGQVGDQINFTCDDGYMLHGSAKLSCLTGGVWSDNGDDESTPTCKAKCDNVTLHYGDCHPSCQGAVGDSIKIVCHDGVTYEMNCIANGTTVTWNISIPQCSASANTAPVSSSSTEEIKVVIGPVAAALAVLIIIVIIIVAVVSWKFGRLKGGYRGRVTMTADEQIHFFAEDNNDDDDDNDATNGLACNINDDEDDDDDEILK